jgi:hypothetical protein
VVLGGLVLTSGVTNNNFYSMIEILIIPTGDIVLEDEPYFFLRNDDGIEVEKDDHPLLPGNYYIVAKGGLLHDHPSMVKT